MFEFRHQPLKAVYTTYFIVSTLFVRLPYWFLTAIPPFSRPRKTWPMSRAIILPGIRAYVATWFMTALPPAPGQDPEQIAASGKADQLGFVWVPPLRPELVVGEVNEMAKLQGVAALKTCGYWYKKESVSGKGDHKAGEDEKVILHFHGGGYVTGSSHPKGGAIGPITNGLLQHCPRITRIFAGGYRISASAPFPAKNPFPAALLDALAAYHYLLHVIGFRVENIIVGGDSAGGHLAIALARYIAVNQLPELPAPGALLLLSPTVEWSLTHVGRDSSMTRNARSDFCGQFFRGYTQRSLLGKLPLDAAFTSPWISPASLRLEGNEGLFSGFPKVYLLTGDAEICMDSYQTFRSRLIADIGEDKVYYNEMPDATHDFISMDWHEPERTNALKDISAWMELL